MKRFGMAMFALAMFAACDDKPAEDASKNPSTAVTVQAETDSVPEDSAELRGGVYKKAYEQASKEITRDNVEDRLSALEREIDLDWQKAQRE